MLLKKLKLTDLLKGCGLALLLCTGAAVSQAGTAAGQFSVNITLTGTNTGTAGGASSGAAGSTGVNTAAQSAPGVCVSETLSEQTFALVRVVCGTGQFVSITANPNSRFLGTHGGAFRYVLGPGDPSSDPQLAGQGLPNYFYPGTGTVTAWRIVNVDGSQGQLEVLLTF